VPRHLRVTPYDYWRFQRARTSDEARTETGSRAPVRAGKPLTG
jgi:hypothetical protein